MTQGRLLPFAPSSVSFLIFLFRYWGRRVNNQHFIVGQAVEVVDEEVDLLL